MAELRTAASVARLKDLGLVRRWLTRMTHLLELITEHRDAAERYSIERHFAVAQNRKREATHLLMELQRSEALVKLLEASVLTWTGTASLEDAFEQLTLVRVYLVRAYDLYEAWKIVEAHPIDSDVGRDLLDQAAAAFDLQSMSAIRALPDSLEVLTL